jgi:hypothetical protein
LRSIARPGHRWEDNIKIYFKEIWLEGLNWINLAQERGLWWAVVNKVMILQVAQNAGNFLTISATLYIAFYRKTLLCVVSYQLEHISNLGPFSTWNDLSIVICFNIFRQERWHD